MSRKPILAAKYQVLNSKGGSREFSADKGKGNGNGTVKKWERTTIFLPGALNRNLDLLSIMRGIPKGEIVRTALSEHLVNQGLEPEQEPSVQVSYPG